MAKFYAVRNGRKIGIFETWEECNAQVKGYSGAKYKSFNNYNDAENYLLNDENNEQKSKTSSSNSEIEYKNYAFIDGSYDKDAKIYGSGIIIVNNGRKQQYKLANNNPNIATLHNVAGELEAVKFVLDYACENNLSEIAIFHDYSGIACWATGEWSARLEYTKEYAKFAQNIMNKIKVNFVKVKAHSGNELNEIVDKLAKEAINDFKRSRANYKIQKDLSPNPKEKNVNITSNKNKLEDIICDINDDFSFGDEEDRILIENLKNKQ
ncbi:viroplasmin family protein [Gemella sp. GH3]|uniref:ribonuclease H1 domain-containing protein n=1 Tax=unclassified Gemella TaxID=2624949 RepID=UPI0015CFA696|nr:MULTISPECIES: ribonuclease H family protein [unclassified Gemella]MBF0714592.1 ribonuclease H family protein [Gemella sp. GH3.1]NYS51544.1 viroplasmin family protein [Gemella sp. GH3]